MRVQSLDHLVLTVRDLGITQEWYARVLGMVPETFGTGRIALCFGGQKINLHSVHAPVSPHAHVPTPGSADLCFLVDTSIFEVIAHLAAHHIAIEIWPVERTGATGPLLSVYVRDPDGNLVELSQPLPFA